MRPVRMVFDKLETQAGDSSDIVIEPVRTTDVQAAIVSTKPSVRQLATKYTEWQQEYESV